MSTKALEIDFSITIGSADTDRRMPKLVKTPIGCIQLQEGISLSVREACIAISREISVAGSTCFPMGDEEGTTGRITTGFEILRQQFADITGEEHLPPAVALAMNTNASLRPVDILDIERKCLIHPQSAFIDEPEERTITRILDGSEPRLDVFRIQRTRWQRTKWPTAQPFERIALHEGLILEPTDKAA